MELSLKPFTKIRDISMYPGISRGRSAHEGTKNFQIFLAIHFNKFVLFGEIHIFKISSGS